MHQGAADIDTSLILIRGLRLRLLWQSNQKLAGPIQYRLNHGVFDTGLIDRRANCFGCRSVLKPNGNDSATFKVYAQIKSVCASWMELVAIERRAHPCKHQHNRYSDKKTALAEPIDIRLMK